MLGLPNATEFNKRIPKQKFYEQMDIRPALKRIFVEQIRLINWRNKLAAAILNVAEGERVTEIEVFEIRLEQPVLDEAVLRQIDNAIPYHILFVLSCEGRYQAWIGYKEVSENAKDTLKVGRYYHTEWMEEENLPLKLEGLSLDTVYDNFVRQIAGDALKTDKPESLKESVERDNKRSELQKQIDVLERKIRREKQLNVQIRLNTQLKCLRKEMEIL